jgi:diguanylate cyclase (GGDEF)-like protein/PAS domain S-box-containing protein
VNHTESVVADLFDNLEQARMGVAHIGPDGRWLRANRAFSELCGHTEEELQHMRFTDLIPLDEREGALRTFELLCRGELGSFHAERRLLCKNERSIWVGLTVAALRGSPEAVAQGFFAFFEDITQRKKSDAHVHSLMNRYAHLFNQIPDSIVLFDTDGKIIGFNQRALQQYGYDAETMLTLGVADLEAEDSAQTARLHINTLLLTDSDEFVTTHRTRLGRKLEVHASVQVVNLPEGERIFQALFHDITEQARWERHLMESEERLELALDSAEEGMWDWDIASGKLEVSEQWARMLGMKRSDIRLIADWEPLCHPDDLPEAQRRLGEHFEGKSPIYEYEHRLRHRSGNWIWVLGKAKVVQRDTQGKPQRIVGTNVNITARKQTEDALRQEITKNQLLFSTASDGLHIMDVHGKLLQASDSFCRMLGYTQEEMQGMNVADWDAKAPPGTDFTERFKRLGSESRVLETLHRCKDGRILEVEINTVAVLIQGKKYIYASARDITQRKLTERRLREREATLRAILDNMPHMAWLKDLDGRYLAANLQLAQTAGFANPEEMMGKTDQDIWPEELAAKYRADDIEVAVTRQQKFVEESALDNGRAYWSETFKTPIIDDQGTLIGTTGYARDITERKQAEESMRLSSAIYQNSSEAILVTDEENRIVDVNPAFTTITGYTKEEVVGRDPKLLRSGKHDPEFYRQMWKAILNDGHWQGEIWDKRKNGELYPKWINISVIRHPDGSLYRHVAQFSDITEKKKKEDLIWHQANYDTLTGLPNRRLFRDRLEQELKKSHRSGAPLALLFIDLDRFKEINDTLGHDIGDELLIEAAQRITGCVRESDTVARLGGDEFTVILPEFGEAANVERVAQHLIQALTAPFILKNETCYITASIGITLYPNDADSLDDLMKHADQAMYVAKEEGRNRFSYYTESMQQRAMEKLVLTNDLRHALERDELEVYYQPIVSLDDGKIRKAEALLRWKHPQRGMVSPAVFIPLAEDSGSIHKIGDWVFLQSMRCIMDLRQRFGIELQVSVNKSPLQFTHMAGSHAWLGAMKELGLPPNSLAVEITEGLLLKDSPGVKARLDELYERGVQISMDDFGTGFSSLSYLKKFPVDYLKIDRSFISSLNENASDLALTEAIIVMAHKLGIKTIAEGVETERQRDLLVSFGCDYAQGYWFSHPLPEAEFIALLTGSR